MNLNKMENWVKLKKKSTWVNVTFQEQKDNRNTLHPSFNFITNNKDDVLGFGLKLIDDDNKLIEFIGEINLQYLNL